MRFCIGVGNDENRAVLLIRDDGHLVTFEGVAEADAAAKAVLKDLSNRGMPVGVFTYKLVTVALYSPVSGAVGETVDPGGQSN